MRVEFYRNDEARVTGWDAVRGKRTRIPGTVMALGRGTIPHDLAQYVIEAATGYENGFWGLLAKGATFRSTGRKRTKPGRAVIATYRDDLADSERLAAMHLAHWHYGASTPVTHALTRADEQFRSLGPGDRLSFTWPSYDGTVNRGSASAAS